MSSNKQDFPAYCKACKVALKCKSGKADLHAHAKTAKHNTNLRAVKMHPNIANSFTNFTALKQKVLKAELQNTALIAEHNLAFNLADHLVKMEKSSFDDSKISPEIQCGRLKTSGLMRNVFGAQQFENIVNALKVSKFSICVDESTDVSQRKILSIVVRMRKNY